MWATIFIAPSVHAAAACAAGTWTLMSAAVPSTMASALAAPLRAIPPICALRRDLWVPGCGVERFTVYPNLEVSSPQTDDLTAPPVAPPRSPCPWSQPLSELAGWAQFTPRLVRPEDDCALVFTAGA
ncbi:hypothetical protein SCMU_17130 [Sinomonas cyclohexanicum]|uniref:Secreted protein n=1 Tax=Sinomonas cyclohexanicum TaxID=322009 RepID=A0ABM7PUF7_SINCY|nr:hypothetical protein SCMU_17130 [Corynebacterium cyclohexanicum]